MTNKINSKYINIIIGLRPEVIVNCTIRLLDIFIIFL